MKLPFEKLDITAPNAPALLTIPEVCAAFRVSRATVNRWIASKRIEAVKIGFGTRIKTASALALLGSLPAANFRPLA
jgi:excisionase family DNA binding protein